MIAEGEAEGEEDLAALLSGAGAEASAGGEEGGEPATAVAPKPEAPAAEEEAQAEAAAPAQGDEGAAELDEITAAAAEASSAVADLGSVLSEAPEEAGEAGVEAMEDILKATGEEAAGAEEEAAPAEEAAAPESEPTERERFQLPELPEIDTESLRESLSLVEAGSELENMTGEIAGLLGQLTERARRYQNACSSANHDINDLKSRLRAEERKTSVLKSEKSLLQEELLEMRSRLEQAENSHLKKVEEDQQRIASLEAQVREKENRVRQLEAQGKSLGDELDQTETKVTQAEMEARKARFELERLRNDVDAERQERARLQRALDAREKEIQAIQERGSGEASTIFIDELHRLVRRYENELNVRTGAARDALNALERLRGTPENQELLHVIKENVRNAAALDLDADALKQISRGSGGPAASRHDRGEGPVGEVADSVEDFARDIEALEFESATTRAGRLLNSRQASPLLLMERVYAARSLREGRVASHLMGLVTLLRQLVDAQSAIDRARGRETQETERFYVQLFDLLHHLVRIKAITRATPEAWRFFLDLRGRYSFITSDAQWAAYRDKQLRTA
jgi:hypothetical protein